MVIIINFNFKFNNLKIEIISIIVIKTIIAIAVFKKNYAPSLKLNPFIVFLFLN